MIKDLLAGNRAIISATVITKKSVAFFNSIPIVNKNKTLLTKKNYQFFVILERLINELIIYENLSCLQKEV